MSVRSRYSASSNINRGFGANLRKNRAVKSKQSGEVQHKEPQKRKSILRRFGEYVARNQAALRAAGETTLAEDLSDMGRKMCNGLGSLGEEELDKVHGR